MGLYTRERAVREERLISSTNCFPRSPGDSISKQIDEWCSRGGDHVITSLVTNILSNSNTGYEAVRSIRKKLEKAASDQTEAYNAAILLSWLNKDLTCAPFTRSIDQKLVDTIEDVLRGPVTMPRILLSEIIREIINILGGGSEFQLDLTSVWRHDPGILKLARLGDLAEAVRVLPTS